MSAQNEQWLLTAEIARKTDYSSALDMTNNIELVMWGCPHTWCNPDGFIGYSVILPPTRKDFTVTCASGSQMCPAISLLLESQVKYRSYIVWATFRRPGDAKGTAVSKDIGDVRFTFSYVNPQYDLRVLPGQIVLLVIPLGAALLLLPALLARYRTLFVWRWPVEVQLVVILLLACLLHRATHVSLLEWIPGFRLLERFGESFWSTALYGFFLIRLSKRSSKEFPALFSIFWGIRLALLGSYCLLRFYFAYLVRKQIQNNPIPLFDTRMIQIYSLILALWCAIVFWIGFLFWQNWKEWKGSIGSFGPLFFPQAAIFVLHLIDEPAGFSAEFYTTACRQLLFSVAYTIFVTFLALRILLRPYLDEGQPGSKDETSSHHHHHHHKHKHGHKGDADKLPPADGGNIQGADSERVELLDASQRSDLVSPPTAPLYPKVSAPRPSSPNRSKSPGSQSPPSSSNSLNSSGQRSGKRAPKASSPSSSPVLPSTPSASSVSSQRSLPSKTGSGARK